MRKMRVVYYGDHDDSNSGIVLNEGNYDEKTVQFLKETFINTSELFDGYGDLYIEVSEEDGHYIEDDDKQRQ